MQRAVSFAQTSRRALPSDYRGWRLREKRKRSGVCCAYGVNEALGGDDLGALPPREPPQRLHQAEIFDMSQGYEKRSVGPFGPPVASKHQTREGMKPQARVALQLQLQIRGEVFPPIESLTTLTPLSHSLSSSSCYPCLAALLSIFFKQLSEPLSSHVEQPQSFSLVQSGASLNPSEPVEQHRDPDRRGRVCRIRVHPSGKK